VRGKRDREIVELWARHLEHYQSFEMLAKRFKCSDTTIRSVLRANGLPARPRESV
jgi:hypothetical protein